MPFLVGTHFHLDRCVPLQGIEAQKRVEPIVNRVVFARIIASTRVANEPLSQGRLDVTGRV